MARSNNLLSVVIPTYREGGRLLALLESLQVSRQSAVEIIVVDGEGSDSRMPALSSLCDALIQSAPGRGLQMNAGAAVATSPWLLFLHADSGNAAHCIAQLLVQLKNSPDQVWGFFKVQIRPLHLALECVASFMNLRSRTTGIATGDQGMWVNRKVFTGCGGFSELRLMEDIALSDLLAKQARPLQLTGPLITDARRWLARGWLRTMVQMWWLRLRYWAGTPGDVLAARYYPNHSFEAQQPGLSPRQHQKVK
ncbi:TIGR04283 family arsenosugar biosynthesis glycosyltransferase [Simiduia sp. 21SJ11W-1]|uniref:TIGR04283 family arsenosugar biosynthesis glycosyltransferase n=1 Tax=Simiduia sp. 21SJ11W-1 TaxID=2909669 RepID=UPI0020A18DE4|nr:TIGR04283 family arsenosugar biosynthesis glycosyltransferase [Simiduia sp. 21SJ11W-1]UTA49433.1 TIGR04283 family arsenosugar biosynthesis glycosyltransferase [Simiduia sp. 21SJ11W-1]